MGAILLANKLADFPKLARKALRIIQYEGNSRLSMLREDIGKKGYASDFEYLLKYIEALTPTKENIDDNGLREKLFLILCWQLEKQ